MSQHTEASASPSSNSPASAAVPRMPQVVLILGFLAATVVLRLATDMTMHAIVVLVAAGGGIGVGVLVAASVRQGGGRLLRRLLKAALTSGSGS
ncbi:hypothetical protein ACVB8X_43830 [Streptomyces sp. NRAIS4]